MSIKKEVKELISENKIRQSIKLLKEWLYKTGNEQLENELILLDNRYNRVKEKERNNTTSYSETLREQSVIAMTLLDILTQIQDKPESSSSTRVRYFLVIEADFDENNKNEIENIVQKLISITDDYSIKTEKVVSGSIKLYLEGTEESFEKLLTLYIKGKLGEMIGFEVTIFNKTDEEGKEKPIKKLENNTILFLASNPTKVAKLQLEKEFVRVSSSLQEGEEKYKLVAEWAVTPNELQKALLHHKPTIVHFSGHGESSTNFKDGGIVLQDAEANPKIVSGKALSNLFRILTKRFKINVVLLNACYSEEQANAISKNVPYVIGMKDTIRDDSAIEFSTGFYRGLATEDDIEFAFELARNMIELEGLPDDEIPVLEKKK